MQDAAHSHPWKVSDVVIFPALIAASALTWVLPAGWLPESGWLRYGAGGALLGGGGAMILWAKRTLDAGGQPNLPGEPTTRLLIEGAFRWSRNPNYLGAVVAIFSGAFLFNSLWFALAAPAVALILGRWMIRPEEAYLSARFGEAYDAYRRRTRRWL